MLPSAKVKNMPPAAWVFLGEREHQPAIIVAVPSCYWPHGFLWSVKSKGPIPASARMSIAGLFFLAGTPAYIQPASSSILGVTTEPAATTQRSPIVHGPRIVQLLASQT